MGDRFAWEATGVIMFFIMLAVGFAFVAADCNDCYSKKCPIGSRPEYSDQVGCICLVRPE